jgi:hypothetical protein
VFADAIPLSISRDPPVEYPLTGANRTNERTACSASAASCRPIHGNPLCLTSLDVVRNLDKDRSRCPVLDLDCGFVGFERQALRVDVPANRCNRGLEDKEEWCGGVCCELVDRVDYCKYIGFTLEIQRKADLFVKGNVSCRRPGSYGVPPNEL